LESVFWRVIDWFTPLKDAMPKPSAKPFPESTDLPDSGDYWALLERVVASTQLKRAARLREFLLFVGQRHLKDGCDQIHEQEIGTNIFGRPNGYDTSVDNIVRVNATELRKRIESYFEAEGAGEPLLLEIPRGSYKPTFRWRSIEPQGQPGAASPAVPPVSEEAEDLLDAKPAFQRFLPILTGALLVLLTLLCGFLWMQNRALRDSLYAWKNTPSTRSFWSGILEAQPNTDVVLADTSFALIEDITKKPISLNDYLSRKYISKLEGPELSQDRRDDLHLIAARNFGSLGDFRAAQRIAALDPMAQKIHLHYARDYTPALIKQNNVILIGSRKSNPWVDLFTGSMNFTVQYDPNRFVSFIQNRAPAAGEQQIYSTPPPPESSSGYSVIAYLPNPGQNGKALIIEGTGSEATEGAGDFLTSEDQLARFRKLLHVDKLPYFEVLLKTNILNGTPLDAEVVAYRTYPNLH
jgi:hypothetical protein